MKNKILLVFLAVILAIALVVGGCAAPPEAPEKPTAPVEPIKIGAPIPLTGPYAADGAEMQDGLTLAIEEMNAQGGLLGRPLELITFDTKALVPEESIAGVEYLVVRNKVDAVITGYENLAAIALYGAHTVPYLHYGTVHTMTSLVRENIDEYSNVFMLTEDSGPYGRLGFEIITEKISYEFPNNKAAVIAVDYEYNLHPRETFKEAAAEKGWEIVVDELVPFGVTEWGPILAKIKATEPAIILFSNLVPVDGATFLEQFLEAPTNSLIYATYFPSIPEFLELAGEAVNGLMWITSSGILPTPEGKALLEKFEQRFGYEGGMWNPGGMQDAFHVWAEAVKRVGNVEDHRAICTAIRDYPYTGYCGTCIFDPEDLGTLAGKEGVPMHFYQIQDGEHIFLFPERWAGGEFEVPYWIK